MSEKLCVRCGKATAVSLGIFLSEEGVSELGGRGFHCGRCAAEALAESAGTELCYLEVAPITMTNAAGRPCLFHFQYLTGGPQPCLKALELEEGVRHGYEIAVLALPEEPSVSLVGRLLAKMRRMLARIDVEEDPQLTLGLRMTSSEMRGVLAHDPEHGGPCVFIDGRKVDWKTFGRLLLSHEGFQFQLVFHDLTDEI